MTPQDQTILTTTPGTIHGDCFATCVASILDLDRQEVPHFMETDPWWPGFQKWLFARGLDCEARKGTGPNGEVTEFPTGYWIGSGRSPNADCNHAVVMLDDQLAHDPNPSRRGLASPVQFSYKIFQIFSF